MVGEYGPWFSTGLLLTTQPQLLRTLRKKPLEHIVEKGENNDQQHFVPFQNCFLLYQERNHNFSNIWFVVCNCFEFGVV